MQLALFKDNPVVKPRRYTRLVDGPDRLPKDVVDLNEPTAFTLWNEKTEYLVFDDILDARQWYMNSNIRTIHEVVREFTPQKLRFDLDGSLSEVMGAKLVDYVEGTSRGKNIVETIISAIYDAFDASYGKSYGYKLKSENVCMCSSSNEAKLSYHITIVGYHVESCYQAAWFYDLMMKSLPAEYHQFVDGKIYSRNHNFRMALSHKKEDPSRVKKIITKGHSIDDTMVQHVYGSVLISSPGWKREPIQANNAGTVPDDTIKDILVIARAHITGGGNHYKMLYEGTYFRFMREKPSYCEMCNKTHDSDNTEIIIYNSDNGAVLFKCDHDATKRLKRIGNVKDCVRPVDPEHTNKPVEEQIKVRPPRVYNVANELKKRVGVNDIDIDPSKVYDNVYIDQINERFMPEFRFEGDRFDTLAIRSRMNSRKSVQLRAYINMIPDHIKVIFISFRKTFTNELKGLLPDFTSYLDVESKSIDKMRLIVQYESLHRLILDKDVQTVLILDESESIIAQAENDSINEEQMSGCDFVFECLLTTATKVIALDANLTQRTLKVLQMTRAAIKLVYNKYTLPEAENYKHIHYATFPAWTHQVCEWATLGDPFVVCSGSLKKAKMIAEIVHKCSPAARVKVYNGESTNEDKLDFLDVNEAWKDVDILIYTGTLSAGCSFIPERFKVVFGYFHCRSVDYLTAHQMLNRVRNVATREYHLFINGGGAKTNETLAGMEKIVDTIRAVQHIKLEKEETVEKVEEILLQDSEKAIGNVATKIPRAVRFVNQLNLHEYRNKGLRYWMKVYNLLIQQISRRNFKRMFLHIAQVNNYEIKMAPETQPEDLKDLQIEVKQIDKEIANRSVREIIEAPILDDLEYKAMNSKDFLTKQEQVTVAKTKLCDTYQVAAEAITPAFVKTFDNERSMGIFRNYQHVSCFGEGGKVEREPTLAFLERSKITRSNDPANARNQQTLKMLFGIDCLNILTGDTWTFDNKQRELDQPLVTEKCKSLMMYLQPHAKTIRWLFDMNSATKIDNLVGRKLKGQLEFINAILGGTFDIEIKLDKNNRDRFFITPSNNIKLIDRTAQLDDKWRIVPV